jgi:putative SOS response-associated peptidase YedK
MCGRARLSSDVSEITIAFGIPPERPTPNFAASWNMTPTDPLPIVRYDAFFDRTTEPCVNTSKREHGV